MLKNKSVNKDKPSPSSKVSISFIVPRRISESSAENIARIHRFTKKLGLKYEVIVSNGNSATTQRNRSADLATSDYLYFLDNDSLLQENTLNVVVDFIAKCNAKGEKIDLIGGPSLLQLPAPVLQRSIAAVLAAQLVVGEVAARYGSIGKPRHCDEKSLILCNMLVSRKMFFELKKFYEMLYPAEEVDFVMRANRMKKTVYYHPEMVIRRPQRATYGKFVYQMFNYGIGRAEMTKLVPLNLNWFFLFPGLALFLGLTFLAVFAYFHLQISLLLLAGISALYLIYTLFVSCLLFPKAGAAASLAPIMIATCHIAYSIGIITGFFRRRYAAEKRVEKMEIEKLGSKKK